MEETGKIATPPTRIEHFAFEWAFLSNFYPAEVRLWIKDGMVYAYEVPGATVEIYASVEHAYQASKTLKADKRWIFQLANNPKLAAGQAKHLGKKLKEQGHQREDWHEVNTEVMLDLLRQKFSHDPLKKKLIATGTAYLEEGNWWEDRHWGVCYGGLPDGFEGRKCKKWPHDPEGQNRLGILLMSVRDQVAEVAPTTPAAV